MRNEIIHFYVFLAINKGRKLENCEYVIIGLSADYIIIYKYDKNHSI